MSDRKEQSEKREIREECYSNLHLSAPVRTELEKAISASPAKGVGKGRSIYSMRTLGASPKSDKGTDTASHTVEQVHKWECEISSNVLAFYTQVPIKHVVRMRNGRRHVSNSRLDGLVFTKEAILLRECKTESWLKAAVTDHPDWEHKDGRYIHVPLNDWSNSRGVKFEAWYPLEPSGPYGSNLSTLAPSLLLNRDPEFLNQAELVLELLGDGRPCNLSSLLTQKSGVSYSHIEYLLSKERIFGTLRSKLLSQDDFIIGADRDTVRAIDDQGMTVLSLLDSPAVVKSWLNTAPTKHIEFAVKRLDLLKKMEQGAQPWTRDMRSLRESIGEAWADPGETLRLLLPNFGRCGNRLPRLAEGSYELINAFSERFEKGEWQCHLEAWGDYLKESEEKGIEPASKTTLYSALRDTDPAKRALATGGVRAFQQKRQRTQPSKRSTPSIKVRHTVHIDSTTLDIRTRLCADEKELVTRGWVYVCRDAHGMPLARSFVLDSPRTQGVALLWRDYVSRWYELPVMVHEDCGPDQTSDWHIEFARGRFDLRLQQAGNSRANQPAEDLQNHINSTVCHRLEGNTLSDRRGRAVDGKFKSVRTVRHMFSFVTAAIDEFLWSDAPRMLNKQLDTYDEEAKNLISIYGSGGRPVAYDDDFLIATSIEAKSWKFSEKNGIRTTDGYFLNSEMQVLLRTSRPSKVLADSSNPALLWVMVGDVWFRAWRSDASSYVDASEDYKLSMLFTQRDVAAVRRKHHEELKIARWQKLKRDAERASNGTTTREPESTAEEDLDYVPDGFSVDPNSLFRDI